jgi:hypothetical protein
MKSGGDDASGRECRRAFPLPRFPTINPKNPSMAMMLGLEVAQ